MRCKRASGLQAIPRRLVGYTSQEAHSSVARAFVVLGLGASALRRITVDADFRMEVSALERAIDADQRAGLQPFCIIGSAGTVNTGATDPLEALGRVARERKLAFHVDAAFGAWLGLSRRTISAVSLALDARWSEAHCLEVGHGRLEEARDGRPSSLHRRLPIPAVDGRAAKVGQRSVSVRDELLQ